MPLACPPCPPCPCSPGPGFGLVGGSRGLEGWDPSARPWSAAAPRRAAGGPGRTTRCDPRPPRAILGGGRVCRVEGRACGRRRPWGSTCRPPWRQSRGRRAAHAEASTPGGTPCVRRVPLPCPSPRAAATAPTRRHLPPRAFPWGAPRPRPRRCYRGGRVPWGPALRTPGTLGRAKGRSRWRVGGAGPRGSRRSPPQTPWSVRRFSGRVSCPGEGPR
mmetsp:Transcript_39060/g.87351  ORF Transcript_39060/g.87351 Transcript_39060/m.87351 type:complete len:217 (-) Transcript_39060:2766-3416(-)